MTQYTGHILLAEDDPDDRYLLREALAEANFTGVLHEVTDGVALLDYLTNGASSAARPRPHFIILDLNMPRKDGREFLAERQRSLNWRDIPVIVLTTSNAEDDIRMAYLLGANSYIRKPASFRQLTDIMTQLLEYWITTVTLPPSRPSGGAING